MSIPVALPERLFSAPVTGPHLWCRSDHCEKKAGTFAWAVRVLYRAVSNNGRAQIPARWHMAPAGCFLSKTARLLLDRDTCADEGDGQSARLIADARTFIACAIVWPVTPDAWNGRFFFGCFFWLRISDGQAPTHIKVGICSAHTGNDIETLQMGLLGQSRRHMQRLKLQKLRTDHDDDGAQCFSSASQIERGCWREAERRRTEDDERNLFTWQPRHTLFLMRVLFPCFRAERSASV